MGKESALLIGAIIFGLISLLHLIRAILGWEANIGSLQIPIWLSWLAFLVAGGIAIWFYKSR
ncbi:MAG: hypothetical protein HYS32_01835 [Candidatus Woesearchaeota archaeon]|nr:MAG: hypothetical protein HYS32_01835 [Candidatus Woesearchaeota archaeon]